MCLKTIFMAMCLIAIQSELFGEEIEVDDFNLSDSQTRFARMRCLAQYTQADVIHFANNAETQCFLQCFLYKTALLDLRTRGLDYAKFLEISDNIEESSEEKCMDKFDFAAALSGKCSDTYRKLMELRTKCLQLFEYIFGMESSLISQKPIPSKAIGQTASEYCDSLEEDIEAVTESSLSLEVTFLSLYKKKLECLYKNYHYLDAYGRVDESELLLSYRDANMYSSQTTSTVKACAQRANGKFQDLKHAAALVWELHTCLKQHSPEFSKVNQRRDELSRQY